MPDLPLSVHRPPFRYFHPVYQAAREKVLAQANGCCPFCFREVPLEAHHRTAPYPPAHETTADDLIAICRDCHDLALSGQVKSGHLWTPQTRPFPASRDRS